MIRRFFAAVGELNDGDTGFHPDSELGEVACGGVDGGEPDDALGWIAFEELIKELFRQFEL